MVLGQMDPGPAEERIVARLYEQSVGQLGGWQPAPAEYWRAWREECALADVIIVNSTWSQRALLGEGIPGEKIRVIPLAYEASAAKEFKREYPAAFTLERPLRALFLGQINLRKGALPLIEATRLLRHEPIEFWFTGPVQIRVPDDLTKNPRVRWFGPVARGEAQRFYRDADVFVFPTYSDGFGLTQLEAQAWKLPVVSSEFCGEVVQHGQNGLVLDQVSKASIIQALQFCLENPRELGRMSANSRDASEFGLGRLEGALQDIAASLETQSLKA
jgi:glycosyltransferase involved in cell wall biosynthesis